MTTRSKKTRAFHRAAVEKRRSTALPEAKQRAVRLDTIGKVAAVLSHESRNLLGALGTCAQVLRRNPHLTADDIELLDIMQSGANRLIEIVAQFAIFRRANPTLSTVNLPDIVEETLARLRQDERCSAQIAIERWFDSTIKLVRADAEGLRRVLWELCLNGAQAIGQKGTLVIETRRAGQTILIIVSDSGPGVEASLAQAIFEPLFTTRTRATGLGLSIVKRIVEEHGGTVSVESESRKGARFAVTLPSKLALSEKRKPSK